MNLFVKTLTGKNINLGVKAGATIEEIKAKIQEQGFPLNQQRLTLELDDGCTLSDYNIQNGATLHLRLSTGMRIFVKVMGLNFDKTVTLEVEPSYTLENIKAQIEKATGKAANLQKLMLGWDELQDQRTLADYEIQESATLYSLLSTDSKHAGGLKMEGNLHIFVNVKSAMGDTLSFRVSRSDMIETLKGRIMTRIGYPVDQQRLIFDGRQLEDGRTLSDYNITCGSTIHLSMRFVGC